MKEWSNRYNPFNSSKVLMYPKHLEEYAKGNYLYPITVAIDPINTCNIKCKWCNAKDILAKDTKKITVEEAKKLSKFLSDWGVVGNCIAGGGEPMMNKDGFNTLITECHRLGISNGVITNGTLLDDATIKNIAHTCRWIGISVDAGSKETYQDAKGVDLFETVLNNIKKLRTEIDRVGSECEIGYKFLLHPDNQHDIYNAAGLAKMYGCHQFQLRPSAILGVNFVYDKEMVDYQIEESMLLESSTFEVYGIRHKYDSNFNATFEFDKCRASSLHPVFCADGTLGLCIDRRGDDKLTLCNWKEDNVLDHWNSQKHKKILDEVNFKECPKCTFSEYNKIIEEVFIKDRMCRFHI